ncbi:MAG: pyridoxal-phosphate dependent enzyme [Hyphomicrobiales bacterium]
MTPSQSVHDTAERATEARNRISRQILETPLLHSRVHEELSFKAENLQGTGSFKLRGAASKLSSLPADTPLITASSGNHGMACAQAARATGHTLTVVLPQNVVGEKLEGIKQRGAKVILHGSDPGKAELHARECAHNGEFVYVSPYNDQEVIAGQGTIGLELLEQAQRIDNVFISMGGGGLIAGIGAVLKEASPHTRIIGVAAENSAALAASIDAGKVVETQHLETLADGVAGGVDEGSITLPLAMDVVDEIVHCSEVEIANALNILAWQEKQLVEGAAGLALAGYLKGGEKYKKQENIVLLCGANFDAEKMKKVLGMGTPDAGIR